MIYYDIVAWVVKLFGLWPMIIMMIFNNMSTPRGVLHYGIAPIYLKKYLKAKEELRKFKYFTMEKYNLK